jgi:hypothetical protein
LAAVFLSNAMLTQWSDQGKVRLEDTTLTLLQENRTVKLKPAVRFTKTIDGSPDPNSLLGKVKTKEQLDEMKAEHYLDSVILGDTGYQVIEGFLGDLSPPPKGVKVTPAPQKPKEDDSQKRPPSPEHAKSDLEKEAEALSELFLKTVKG